MSHASHKQAAQSITARCAIITLSDTRIESTDTSGQLIRGLLQAAHHTVASYILIPDDPTKLATLLDQHLASPDIDVILTNGGTGISPRDQTIPTIESRIQTMLPGFGELFRMLSYDQIGSAAYLSRATAGIAKYKPLFALPGSSKAVELAMTKLILPELPHLLSELRKHPGA